MPIIGSTDLDSLEIRYPEVGRLFKGGPKRKRKRGEQEYLIFGEELPHFRFVSQKAGALAAFTSAFGKEPQRLVGYLPYPTPDECFSTWIEAWSGGGRLLYRSDGVRTVRRWLEARKVYSDKAEDQIAHPGLDDEQWVGRLNVFFPAILTAGYPGVVLLTTHGKHDCVRIASTLHALARDFRWRERGLAGLEVVLYRQQVEHTDPDGKKRSHWDVFVEASERIVIAQLERARQEIALLPTSTTRVIDSQTGEVLFDDTEEEVNADEQAPEAVPGQADPVPQARAPGKKVEAPAHNGKPKMAVVGKASRWRVRANEFAEQHPAYMGEAGPNFVLILTEAAAKGYDTITDDNLEAMLLALESEGGDGESEAPGEPVVEQEEIPF